MRKFKLKGKLLTSMISSIILFSVAVNIIIYFQFNKSITTNMLKTSSNLSMQVINEKYQGNWKVVGNNLYKGNKLINNDTQVVDSIKNNAHVQCTIFLDNTRVATTIIGENNKRAVGTTADKNVVEKVLNKGNEFIGDVKIIEKDYDTMYVPIKDGNGTNVGMFFIGIEKSTIDKEINSLISKVVICTLILIAIIILIISYSVSKIIIKPVKYTEKQLNLIASGNLTLKISDSYVNRNDEFGEISKSAKLLQESFRKMIGKIKQASLEVMEKSQTLSSNSEEMYSVSENVYSSIQQIATGTEQQAKNLNKIDSNLNEFGNLIENMVKTIEDVNTSNKEVYSMSMDSNKEMEILIKLIEDINNTFNIFTKQISSLGENIGKINEMTTLINNIAKQTNLLSLNATIESARAGSSGRGFSIVAEEIRKLADQSKISSNEITNLVGNIYNDTQSIVDNTQNIDEQLNKGVKFVRNAIDSYEKIINEIKDIKPKIEYLNNSADKISKEKSNVLERCETIVIIADEMSSFAEEITASSKQMNESSEEVATSTNSLNTMAKEMLEDVNKFNI